MVENYDQCRDVVDVYFEKSLLRSSNEEVLKKVLGILLVDASEKKSKIKDVMFEITRFQVQSATPSPWVLASSKKTS